MNFSALYELQALHTLVHLLNFGCLIPTGLLEEDRDSGKLLTYNSKHFCAF